MSSLEFAKKIEKGHIVISETEVMISCGWTVHIPRAQAAAYALKGTNEPVEGFHAHAGYLILSHNGAKIALPEAEGKELIEGIKKAYLH